MEIWGDPRVPANVCFKLVSRYWDRIAGGEQFLPTLPRGLPIFPDPADCGPAVLSLPQDVQAEAAEFPESFFARRLHRRRRPGPDEQELALAATELRKAKAPLIIAGGGVHYSEATAPLAEFAQRHGIPVAETQ